MGSCVSSESFATEGHRGPGAAFGRNQIRSTKSEILNPQDGRRDGWRHWRHKSESPKLKIQNKP